VEDDEVLGAAEQDAGWLVGRCYQRRANLLAGGHVPQHDRAVDSSRGEH
jgi:hypothetical protein